MAHQRSGQRHPLLLAPRELVRLAAAQLADAHHVERPLYVWPALRPRYAARSQHELEIPGHGQVRPQRQVLEDESDAALAGRHQSAAGFRDQRAVDGDGAGIRHLEAGDEAQQRRLAAAARAEDYRGSARSDVERHVRRVPGGNPAASIRARGRRPRRSRESRRARRAARIARGPRTTAAWSSARTATDRRRRVGDERIDADGQRRSPGGATRMLTPSSPKASTKAMSQAATSPRRICGRTMRPHGAEPSRAAHGRGLFVGHRYRASTGGKRQDRPRGGGAQGRRAPACCRFHTTPPAGRDDSTRRSGPRRSACRASRTARRARRRRLGRVGHLPVPARSRATPRRRPRPTPRSPPATGCSRWPRRTPRAPRDRAAAQRLAREQGQR